VVRASVPGRLNNLTVVAPGTIYAVGDGTSLLVSTDGGAHVDHAAAGRRTARPEPDRISCTGTDVCVISTRTGDAAAAHHRRRGDGILGDALDEPGLHRRRSPPPPEWSPPARPAAPCSPTTPA
jgi:hypothetical protein